MAKLYSNENFPQPVVEALRKLGHDVLTSQDAGNAHLAIPDEDVLEYAVKDGRAVLTLNRKDFIRLRRRAPLHSGIIVCTENPDFPALAAKINAVLQATPSLGNDLLRINRGD